MQNTTLLIAGGLSLTLTAAGILTHDVGQELRYRRAMASQGILPLAVMLPMRWRTTAAIGVLAWAPLLLALGLLFRACAMVGGSGG